MARNKLLVPDAKKAIDALKNEIAQEFGIILGADTSSRLNGSVGGEMVKRLVKMAQEQLSSGYSDKCITKY
ncbi:MAG: alpha/beta-type small acid-soluble spore protein [Bacilli bacterium]|nr:alpha/beta-type small acid-soluble spore protein [Bacilli bacterium]